MSCTLYYIAIKSSLHSMDTTVFGLSGEEVNALSKKYGCSYDGAINGVVIKTTPIQLINTLSELGYKIVCCSGESELTWTMVREFLITECPIAYTIPKILVPVKHWMNLTLKEEFGLQYSKPCLRRIWCKNSNHFELSCKLFSVNVKYENKEGAFFNIESGLPDKKTENAFRKINMTLVNQDKLITAQHNDIMKVKQWIIKKDINALDRYGYTALHYASRNGHLEMCKLLISNGADVNALTRSGKVSPLHRCVSMGHCDIFKLLLESGAQIDVKDDDGKTVLHRAVEGGHCQLVEKILKINPSLAKVTDKRGFTPKECLNISTTLFEIFNKYKLAD